MKRAIGIGAIVCSTTLTFAVSSETLDPHGMQVKDNSSEVRVFGVGQRSDDKTYQGLGIEYKDDQSKAGLEYGDDYQKLYGVYKYALPESFYLKGGLGYLNKEIIFSSETIDTKQYTLGTSVGYGDDNNYNIELGYLGSKLSDAYDASGYTNTFYVEALGQYEMNYSNDYGTLEAVGTYQNSHVFHRNYSGMILEGAYYPIEDIRASVEYNDAQEVDDNNYRVILGAKYAFASQKWSPIFTAKVNNTSRVSYRIVYDEDIENDPLSNRDFFENQVGTGTIKAQEVAANEFNQRVQDAINRKNGVNNQNSTPTNHVSVGESFTVDALSNWQASVDLTSHISDADGDTLTINYVSSGILSGDLHIRISDTGISGTTATITVDPNDPANPTAGSGYIDYTISDEKSTSAVYRITFSNMSGVS